jgi:sorbitol-specific phosphotransferase system component IIBC
LQHFVAECSNNIEAVCAFIYRLLILETQREDTVDAGVPAVFGRVP